MLQTILTSDAAHRLRRGHASLHREDIVKVEGTSLPGEPAQLVSEDGTRLGLGDVDLQAAVAVRRLGLPEERAEGIIPRQLRRAFERRRGLVEDPRYCRIANDDGDGLPGLLVDRYDGHYALITLTRAMDARALEVAKALEEIALARSVMLRNDSWRRQVAGLPLARRHVLAGAPARWTRIQELGARLTIDLHAGIETGYRYDQREVRRAVARLSSGARVLELTCHVGGKVVQAGRGGARQIVAYDADPDSVELTRENVELNGLGGRAHVEHAPPLEALGQVHATFDLVLLDLAGGGDGRSHLELLRGAVRATVHGGRLLVSATRPVLESVELRALIARAASEESRAAFRLLELGPPGDFPAVLDSPPSLSALVVELG